MEVYQPNSPVANWRIVVIIHLLSVAIALTAWYRKPHRTVSHSSDRAANQWLQGEPIYAESAQIGHGFLYLPHAAILLIPFVGLDRLFGMDAAGDIAWRCLSWFVLAVGSWRFVNLLPAPVSRMQWRVALVTCLLGAGSLRIGQSTVLLTGLLLLAIETWSNRKFNQSAFWLGLALAVKPLAFVGILLLWATSAPMRLRLLISLLVVAVFPFAFQTPEYVWQQYLAYPATLKTTAELGSEVAANWAQIFGMLDFFGLSVSGNWQTTIRVIGAIVALVLVWTGVRKLAPPWPAVWMLSWMTIYLMLFNPRTENSTYCMFGPVLGIWLSEAVARKHVGFSSALLTLLVFLTMGSYELGRYLTPIDKKPIWLAPLCCCIAAAYLSYRFLESMRSLKIRLVERSESIASKQSN